MEPLPQPINSSRRTGPFGRAGRVGRSQQGAADWFLIGMIAAVIVATLLPQAGQSGGWLHLDRLGTVGIFLLFFLHGMGLSASNLKHGATRWRLHLLVQSCTYVVFPLWWWVLKLVLGERLPADLWLGLFYLAVLPSTVSSSVALTALARGNVAAAVLNATLSSLLGVLLTPLLASLAMSGSGMPALHLGDTMLKIAVMLVLPFALGQLLRPWMGAWFLRVKPATAWLDRGVILLLVWCAFSDSVADGLWSRHGWPLLLLSVVGVLLFLFPMLWLTRRLARWLGLPVEDEIVAVFCGSKKTLASGVPMARVLFEGSPSLGVLVLPIMLYHQLQLFVCTLLAKRYAQRSL